MSKNPICIDNNYLAPHEFKQKGESLCLVNSECADPKESKDLQVTVTIKATKGVGLKRIKGRVGEGQETTICDVGESAEFRLKPKGQLTLVHQLCSPTKISVKASDYPATSS